jgi:hypothetical protein
MPKHADHLPAEILLQHIAVLGKTGSGKTSTAKLAIEQVVAQGARVCVLDPIKSDWWGLTSSANGKRAGLPFHILGGPHGHVPLHSAAGKAIADVVASGALPMSIIDMADFEPGGQAKFFVDFAPALLRKMRGVVYLVIEEAHLFAPKERSGIGAENLSIHWAKTIATAGRSKGVRLVLVTQRTQALHNALLGSCDTLIAHRLTAPADQEPVVKWLKANTSKEVLSQVTASLASLKTGEGWICSGEAKLFELVHFPRITTYDNTATPTGDGDTLEIKTAAVDPEKLRAIIGDAVDKAKADDPRELRKTIGELKKQLGNKQLVTATNQLVSKPPKVIEKLVLKDGQLERAEALVDRAINGIMAYHDRFRLTIEAAELKADKPLTDLRSIVDSITAAIASSTKTPASMPRPQDNPTRSSGSGIRPDARIVRPAPRAASRVSAVSRDAVDSNGYLPPGEKATLVAAAQYPDGLTREQASILTGYKRSSRDTYIQRLIGKGYVSVVGGYIVATDAGVAALGVDYEPLPVGEDLQRYWLERLPPGEKAVLEIALKHYPHSVQREVIEEAAGYKRSSRDTYIQRLQARQLLAKGGGPITASEVLFEA